MFREIGNTVTLENLLNLDDSVIIKRFLALFVF